MSELTAAEIQHLAKLARLELSADEQEKLSADLPKILTFVEELRSVKLARAQTQPEAEALANLRSDEPSTAQLSLEDIQALAPEFNRDKGYVVVPAVFAEQETPDV